MKGCGSCHTPSQNSHTYFFPFGALLNAVTTPAIFLQVGRERNLQEFCLHLRI